MGRISPEGLRQTIDSNKELFHKEYPNWELTRVGRTPQILPTNSLPSSKTGILNHEILRRKKTE